MPGGGLRRQCGREANQRPEQRRRQHQSSVGLAGRPFATTNFCITLLLYKQPLGKGWSSPNTVYFTMQQHRSPAECMCAGQVSTPLWLSARTRHSITVCVCLVCDVCVMCVLVKFHCYQCHHSYHQQVAIRARAPALGRALRMYRSGGTTAPAAWRPGEGWLKNHID